MKAYVVLEFGEEEFKHLKRFSIFSTKRRAQAHIRKLEKFFEEDQVMLQYEYGDGFHFNEHETYPIITEINLDKDNTCYLNLYKCKKLKQEYIIIGGE